MDWKKLLKAIGIALATVGLIALVVIWVTLLQMYPVVIIAVTAFCCFVAFIYSKLDEI